MSFQVLLTFPLIAFASSMKNVPCLNDKSENHCACRWVAHPALVTIAKEIFDEHMKTPNQIHVARTDVQKGAADLLQVLLLQVTC